MTETDAFQALRLAYPTSQIDIETTVYRTILNRSEEITAKTEYYVLVWGQKARHGHHLGNIVRELCDLAKLENYRKEHAK